MKRVSAPREDTRAPSGLDGRSAGDGADRSNLVLLAAQLIVEEALEAEVRDEVGRERYKRAEGDAKSAGKQRLVRTLQRTMRLGEKGGPVARRQ